MARRCTKSNMTQSVAGWGVSPARRESADPDRKLALRELERAASAGLAGLLTLDPARVAGQEARGLEDRVVGVVGLDQRARDPEADRAGLARLATAADVDEHVELLARAREAQRRDAQDPVL